MDEAARLAAAKRFGFRVTLAMVAGRDARNAPAAARADLCHALVVIALEEKDADLARGLGADGAALVPISERTRVHRRSAMGLADPDAPPLTPAWGLSRTRSFLVGEAAPNADGADFWWMWDAREDVPWGQVLDHHRQGLGRLPVRDVFGCGPACLGRIRARLTAWWLLYRKGQAPALVRQPPVPPEPPPKWAWKAVKPYQPKFPELAVPKKPRRVSQLNVNGRVYTFGASAGGKVSAAGLKRGVANGTFSGFHRWDPETGQLIRPRPGPGPGPGPRPVKPPPPPPPAPRFRPAENAGDRVTVVVDAARLDAAWRRDPDFYVPPGGREEDRQKYANNVAFVARARREGLAIEQPRITVDADGAASFIDGRHRFAALRDAGVESVPVSVDPEEAARARRLLGAAGPPVHAPGKPIAERIATWSEGDAIHRRALEAIEAGRPAVAAALRALDRAVAEEVDVRERRDRVARRLAGRYTLEEARGLPEFQRVDQPWREALQKIEDAKRALLEARAEFVARVHATLPAAGRPHREVGWKTAAKVPATVRRVADEAMAWLTRYLERGDEDRLRPRLGGVVPRSKYDRSTNTVSLRDEAPVRIAVHELGHCLDETLLTDGRKLGAVSKEFLRHRVGDEAPRRLDDLFPGKFHADEMGRKDRFTEALGGDMRAYYAGKVYERGGTEVFALGLEQLYKAPHLLARDPEYFKLVVGFLTGALR